MKRFRFELANATAIDGARRWSHSDAHLRVTVQIEVPDDVDATTAWALLRDGVLGGRTWGDTLRIELQPSEPGDVW